MNYILSNKELMNNVLIILSPIICYLYFKSVIFFHKYANKFLNKIFKTKNKNYINQNNAKSYLKNKKKIKETNDLKIDNNLKKQIIRHKELKLKEKELNNKIK